MTSSGSVYSQTLQEITTTKLQELSKKRASFEKLKNAAITDSDAKDNPIDMLVALADGTRACFGVRLSEDKVVRGSSQNSRLETDLRNLNRFIDQARFDPSLSTRIIHQWRHTLLNHLEVQSLKYQYADLYGQLTVEWLTSSKPQKKSSKEATSETDDADDTDDFEQVAVKAKLEARQKWERSVFEENSVDEKAINAFLSQLFEGKEAKRALTGLREGIKRIEDGLVTGIQFNTKTLAWAIKGLLASELLTNEKRGVLRDFLSNTTILNELADVLNMRLAALSSWSWGSEVVVEARRELNGKFNIYMHEDLLQAIFLQFIGSRWSAGLKGCLMSFVWKRELWDTVGDRYSPIDEQRREWFLQGRTGSYSVERVRGFHYRAGYFVSQLLDSVDQDLSTDEGDVEADFVGGERSINKGIMSLRSATPVSSAQVTTLRREAVNEEGEDMVGYVDKGRVDLTSYRPSNPMDAKQKLLHLLSTEILVRTRVHGGITAFRSQYDAWYTSLPHATITTVLAYLGVSPKWLDFFKTFLQAPLKFMDEDTPARLRKRGTPDAHILSDVFGESVLFCLDFSIKKDIGSDFLWRMKDEFWFWSDSDDNCVKAWKTIGKFNETMGLNLDDAKSATVRFQRKQGKLVPAKFDKILPQGEIRWGMLHLDPEIGRFVIDQDIVDKHIEELRRQLKDKEKSIFAWVQAYSTYASTFFTTNFGKAANCFGREHLDSMLSMHERVQKTLFQASADGDVTSVVDWLKRQIEQRFGVKDVPDGYLFFPTEFGGLDVKSPFVGLLQLRGSITKDPNARLDEFEEKEQTAYATAKRHYFLFKPWLRPTKNNEYVPPNPEEFMPFEEYIQFREYANYGFNNELVDVYEELLRQPWEEALENFGDNSEIDQALKHCGSSKAEVKSITHWNSMNAYWKWVTMLYGPEMIQKFGGLEIVETGLLPMGMVSMFKSGRVSWQE